MNKIYEANSGRIMCDTLVISSKDGQAGGQLSAPSGTAYQLTGVRVGYSNPPDHYQISLHESNYYWTNTGNDGGIFVLPSGAPNGWKAHFVRTDGIMRVDPPDNASIFHSASGIWRANGAMVELASAGAKLSLISNGSGYIPILEEGTID